MLPKFKDKASCKKGKERENVLLTTPFHVQLVYLERLKASSTFKGSNENPEPCPICTQPLGTEWSVLQCGHCFCCECIRTLVDEYTVRSAHRSSVRCAVCRNLTFHGEISYVKTK